MKVRKQTNNQTDNTMTESIKQAKSLDSKFFDSKTGKPLRDYTPHYSRIAKKLLNEASDEIYEYNPFIHSGLLIIAYPEREI